MTLDIGRVFDGLNADVVDFTSTGDSLSLAGELILDNVSLADRPATAAAAKDRIDALIANRAEPVVPVVWSEDPSVDGFYQIVQATCGYTVATLNDGYLPWAIDLERAGGGPAPQLEVYGYHRARVNPHSITDATLNAASPNPRLVGIPESAIDFNANVSVGTQRVSASGNLSLVGLTASLPATSYSTFTVPVEDAYVGACHIRTTYESTPNLLVTGLTGPGLFGDGWVLSNDLIRVSAHATTTALKFEVYDGTQWEDLAGGVGWRFEHDYGGGSNVQWQIATAVVTILRNSPECCTIRLVVPNARTSGQFGRVWIDLTVRRGERFVRGVARCDTMGSLGGVWALEPTSSISSTSITGALRATSNDAAGNRAVWTILDDTSVTLSTSTGRITQNGGTTPAPFMVGVELGGSGSSGIDDDTSVFYQWIDIRSETQRVVRR